MPRPPRRTRPVATKAAPVAEPKEKETTEKATDAVTTTSTAEPAAEKPADTNRRRTRSSDVGREAVASDREPKRRSSLRRTAASTASRQAAAAVAATPTPGAKENAKQTTAASQSRNPAGRPARGPDASGIDLDDDVFGEMDTSFGDHDLGGLSGLEDLGDLDDLDSSPVAAPAADTTSSSFNVGLFRRGRPRQSSIHSRDDAPIRPSSRGPATPSLSSTFSLGTFRRRAREPSILGRRGHHSRQGSRDGSRHGSRHGSRNGSRHQSRDRDSELSELSGSEMDIGPYTSDAEPSSAVATRGTGSTHPTSAQAQDSSVLSHATGNTTSVLMAQIGRGRSAATRAAKAVNAASTAAAAATASAAAAAAEEEATAPKTTTKKRKSQDAPLEDELPKRRSLRTSAVGASSDSVLPSVEAPPSTPPSQITRSPSQRHHFSTPVEIDPAIMAPPASSDSESDSPPLWPTLKTLVHGGRRGGHVKAQSAALPLSRRTPDLVEDSDSELSSPPSLTHSPNYRQPTAATLRARGKAQAQAKAKAAAAAEALTTAALTALLPQRRHRAREDRNDHYDQHDRWGGADGDLDRSALLSEDDDELTHRPAGRRLRRGQGAAAATPLAAAPRSANKQTTTATTGKRRRTYGSRSFADKENEDADGSTFSPLPDNAFEGEEDTTLPALPRTGRTPPRSFGEEVEKAAKKFKEVDKWTLDFESVSRSSSPAGAR